MNGRDSLIAFVAFTSGRITEHTNSMIVLVVSSLIVGAICFATRRKEPQ
jgi:hypothetical protein